MASGLPAEGTASRHGADLAEHLESSQVVGVSATADHDVGEPDSDDASMRDYDSAIDIESYRSSTYSITSSVAERLEENGRTYHAFKEGKYMLPNDETELNRLDLQHRMWEITLNDQLHLSPIGPSPHRVLDIATGSGIWAIDFANKYPSALVTGTDLSAVQPEYVPQNCDFQIDDAEDEWVFSHPFDYIHGRACATCFRSPKEIFRKAFDNLKPGGYFEMQDLDLQTSEDGSIEGTTLTVIQNNVHAALASTGMRWDNASNYRRWMVEVGFEDVTEVVHRWPSNPYWPSDSREKTLGAWFLAQVGCGLLESVCTRIFMTKLGWSKEQLDEFLVRAGKDLKDRNIKAYSPVYIVYGRKPVG
ncbi:putative S-adenosyl-L-methionine-dependent methyltransferase [Seiridium unicorne]|uniref:S-adenosyl-L-methionine-dependent methyltransferase n=1 Tax=Seiridium unicorne TaxID=138068 RepID=A0ABR2VC55_9PEZI